MANKIDIDQLLASLTLEEKCGQLNQLIFNAIKKNFKSDNDDEDDDQIDDEKLLEAIEKYHVGSIIGVPFDLAPKAKSWQKLVNKVQKCALDHGKSKIPILIGIDSVHGANFIREGVLFPQPINLAATFNLKLVEKMARITAVETRAIGIPWNFSPVLDLGRQPLWPRIYETFGEDPYLASEFARVYVKSHQGEKLDDRSSAAACLKHYVGYSVPVNGKDRSPSVIPDIELREVHLPPFEAGVQAGAATVMINSGVVNNIPGHMNGYYINDILRGEMGFKGLVVSDCFDIINLHTRDKVGETPRDAAKLSVMAGIDISMVPFDYSFYHHCYELSKTDQDFKNRLDQAVRNLLQLKADLGLFSDLAFAAEDDLSNIGTIESENTNLEIARESIILAKNENNSLPLSKKQKILITGPCGDSLKSLNGGWSYNWHGSCEADHRRIQNSLGPKKTIFDAIKSKCDSDNIKYVQGSSFTNLVNLEEAVNEAENADIIVLCIGEDSYTEFFGNIDNLSISQPQIDLAEAISKTGKPIVAVYVGGRPRVITPIVQNASAVLITFLPGNRGGEAIADVLFGDYNPCGRLPVTYPKATNGFSTYDHKPSEVINLFKEREIFKNFNIMVYEDLFPFGHGLSYTQFVYSNLKLSTKEWSVRTEIPLTVILDVSNTGQREGKDTVLLYLNDELCSMVSRPLRQLKRFQKVDLVPGATQTVKFELTLDDLMFFNQKSQRVYEHGRFNVIIGSEKASFNLIS